MGEMRSAIKSGFARSLLEGGASLDFFGDNLEPKFREPATEPNPELTFETAPQGADGNLERFCEGVGGAAVFFGESDKFCD
jgi:hypothetical protein